MAEPPYTGPPSTGGYRVPPQPPPPPYWGPLYPGHPVPPEPRPAGVLLAAVFGWVAAGLLLISAGLLFFGAAFLRNIETATTLHPGYVVEFTFDAFLDLLAAGLLVAGGVGLMSRAASGRLMLTGGCAIVVVEAVYWLVRWTSRTDGADVGYAVWFAGLALAAAGCVWSRSVTNWVNRR